MSPFLSEFIGTTILIVLGNGVVANVVLNKTNGQNSGLIVIAFGWAIAVFTAVFISAAGSGAHLNPAVSVGLAVAGKFEWSNLLTYVSAQLLGAMAGSTLVWLAYRDHYDATDDAGGIRATFCNTPKIANTLNNIVTEIIGTFVLVFGVLFISAPASTLGALDALPVAILVLGIGLSLGGPTGYAINPARDLGPRIMHQILPLKHKGDSGWDYSMIPVVGPLIGGVLAALLFGVLG